MPLGSEALALLAENPSDDSSGVVETAGLRSFSNRSIVYLLVHNLVDIVECVYLLLRLCEPFGDLCAFEFLFLVCVTFCCFLVRVI